MKKVVMILLITVSAFTVSAQNSHQNALTLLKLIGPEKNIKAMADNVTVIFSQSFTKSDPQKAQAMLAMIKEDLKYFAPKLTADMVPIYEKHFTAQELQKYIDFYLTPEGQKLLNSTPVLQTEMMTTIMTKYMPEMKKRIAVKMQQIANKKRHSS